MQFGLLVDIGQDDIGDCLTARTIHMHGACAAFGLDQRDHVSLVAMAFPVALRAL
jgi:hypothetical protein